MSVCRIELFIKIENNFDDSIENYSVLDFALTSSPVDFFLGQFIKRDS